MNASTEYERIAQTAERNQRGIAAARNVSANAEAMQTAAERQAFQPERAAVDAAHETRRQGRQANFERASADHRETTAGAYIASLAPLIDAYEASLPVIDYEAIAWAYAKLLAYGVGSTQESALMLDRLNLMLLTAGVAA